MQSGACPICESHEIYRGYSGDAQSALTIGLFTSVELVYYACIDCGYVETYLADDRDRELIARKWERVQAELA